MESSIDEVDSDHSLVDGVTRVHHDVGREDDEEESNTASENPHLLNEFFNHQFQLRLLVRLTTLLI